METENFVICIHEDRFDYLTGVKLAVLSLGRHSPGVSVYVNCPSADADFLSWVSRQPNASVVVLDKVIGNGWNIKASVLMEMLEKFPNVVWIDSDIVVCADIQSLFRSSDASLLIAAQETFWGQQQGGTFRTFAWGLTPARRFETTINSGVLRVTRHHREMLGAWQEMLSHPAYLKAQSQPWYARPLHMIGDQEVLTGLLGSEDFRSIPVRLINRGKDIAQCFGPAGFTPLERLGAIFKKGPALVHAMGPKPWLRSVAVPPLASNITNITKIREWYQYISLELSPYSSVASKYFREDVETGWVHPRSRTAKLGWRLGFGSCAAIGFPLALIDHLARRVRRLLGIARYSCSDEFVLSSRPFKRATRS